MRALVEKLAGLEREIALSKGQFRLFALFLREDAPDVWELLVSAPWVDLDKIESFKFLTNKIKAIATPDELLQISRIVAIAQDDPALLAINTAFTIEHQTIEIQNSNFFGLKIKHAYLITSRRPDA